MEEVEFDFTGRNFVVVGASSGIGREIASELADAGAMVLGIARNRERLQALESRFPDCICTAQLDVRDADVSDWEAVLSPFVSNHGKISGGVYTAGITGVTPLKAFDRRAAKDIIDTSLLGGGHLHICGDTEAFVPGRLLIRSFFFCCRAGRNDGNPCLCRSKGWRADSCEIHGEGTGTTWTSREQHQPRLGGHRDDEELSRVCRYAG